MWVVVVVVQSRVLRGAREELLYSRDPRWGRAWGGDSDRGPGKMLKLCWNSLLQSLRHISQMMLITDIFIGTCSPSLFICSKFTTSS